MNKEKLLQCGLIALISLFSFQSHAVTPFTVTCGDGKKIEVSDSKYNPSGIALACLSAGHEPPLPSKTKPQREKSLSVKETDKPYKVFRTQQLKQIVAKNSGGNVADIDHSDIILMLQGCTCIGSSCVAYRCPVDVDIP